MKNRLFCRKYLVPTAVIICICLLATTLIYFRKYSPYKMTSTMVGNPEIVLSLDHVELVGRSDGQKIFSFQADRADVSRGRYTTLFYGIHEGKLYDDNGKALASVKAGKARYDSITKSVDATDGVIVSSIEGYQAKAEQAIWTAEMKLLRCPGKVSFSGRGNQLVGENLVADLINRQATLQKAHMDIDINAVQESVSADTKSKTGRGQQ